MMGIYQSTIKLSSGTENECFWKRTVEVPEDFSLFNLHLNDNEIALTLNSISKMGR